MKNLVLIEFLAVCIISFLSGFVISTKECTNSISGSHSFQHKLLLSKNETWKEGLRSHYHLTPTDDYAWQNLLPRKFLKEEDEFEWRMMYRKLKNKDGFQVPEGFLKEVSLHDVRLNPNSIHWQTQQTNLNYLLMLDVDNLLWSFRRTAGLSTTGSPYGGWERNDTEIRGHFVGHYLSATALMWASTHNEIIKEKMSALVSGLAECQNKIGSGYLSAFPSEEFERLEAVEPVWAPYYTIHKILAGLLDQYTFANNTQALKMASWMADYFYKRVQNVIMKYSIRQHYQALNDETGGMNDVLYRLYNITENPKHLVLAHLFDKPCFLGVLAMKADDIAGFHSNTHIPIVIGSQNRYEVIGDPLHKEIAMFFMDVVNSSHTYATGGTSVSEFWGDPNRLATTLQSENEESCTTYNMLKISRTLFRWTKKIAYADYYERAHTNGVMGIQRGTDPGVMIYMLPLASGSSKARSYHGWGTPFDSFWCCYGTGIESFSKLGDSIYFEEEGDTPGLYIMQYISSTFDWKSGQIMLSLTVDPITSSDPNLRLTLTFSSQMGAGKSSTLNLRVPTWTYSSGATAELNNQNLSVPAPGSFFNVTRKWSHGDKLSLKLPMSLRTEPIQDDRPKYASIQAILYGHYLLAAHSSGDSDIKTGSADSLSDWITPVSPTYNNYLVSFTQNYAGYTYGIANSNKTIELKKVVETGTDAAIGATFRLLTLDKSSEFDSPRDAIGKAIMLEPFSYPGMVVVTQGVDEKLVVVNSSATNGTSVFHIVRGLDGNSAAISLMSDINKDCYVYTVSEEIGINLLLKNKSEGGSFDNKKASFMMSDGVTKYHPVSFMTKGQPRNFVLQPLWTFKDESYTVYFNITA